MTLPYSVQTTVRPHFNSRVVQHYMLYIYIEVLIAIYTQVCKIRLTVLRDSCSQGFIHFMK